MESSDKKIFIIAEVAQAHEGSLGIAHSYIDSLTGTGVDAIKFQTHIARAESSEFEPFRVPFSYEDKTRYDYWKRMEFSLEQWKGLKKHCDEAGLEFLSSPFSNEAVDILEEVGVKKYKIGSGEVSNLLLLHKIAQTGKEIILSSGMSSFTELKNAVNFLKPFGNKISILQCTTAYPTQPKEWGLNLLSSLRNEFQLPIGFSDHSGDIYACLAAATLGASILEFHVVFDKKMFGPDSKASLTLNNIGLLVKGVRQIEEAINNPVNKDDVEKYESLKTMFGKSLAVNKNLKRGHVLLFEDIENKKPAGKGINAAEYKKVVGKKLKHDLAQYSFLNYEDLE